MSDEADASPTDGPGSASARQPRASATRPGAQNERRAALVQAGWRAIDALPLHRALGGFTTAGVAAEAGVTTGSFFHHFPDAGAYADALVQTMTRLEPAELDGVEDLVQAFVRRADTLRANPIEQLAAALADQWRAHGISELRMTEARHEALMWACHDRELATPTPEARTVADVLRLREQLRQVFVVGLWRNALEMLGLTLGDAIDLDRLATGIGALFQGLSMRAAIEPEAVDDRLFADLVRALVTALAGPTGAASGLPAGTTAAWRTDGADAGPTPQARSGARRRAETRARIVAANTGMFDQGWEEVTATEVADRAGVSVQTVANAVGGVRSVAACTFAAHVPAIEAAAAAASSADPRATAHAALVELARSARRDPEPALALLAERLATIARRGEVVALGDIRTEVLVSRPVVRAISTVLPTSEAVNLGRAMVHLTLAQAATTTTAPDEIASLAMRLLPPEGGTEGDRAADTA